MTIIHDGFPATRRVILKGAGGGRAGSASANIPFSLVPAFAAANDKYPEDAFKSEERSGRESNRSMARTARAIRQGQARRTGKSPRTARWFRSSVSTHPRRCNLDRVFWSAKIPTRWRRPTRFPAGNHAKRGQSPEKMAEDQQRDRDCGSRRQALQSANQGSQSDRRRACGG